MNRIFNQDFVSSFFPLSGIDPNPDNFVCAGIIHTRAVQIGVLLRLEPNKQAEVRISSLPTWNILTLAEEIL